VRGLLVGGAAVPTAAEGELVELVLDRTPFYAEGGGQLADAGRIVLADGTVVQVDDVQKPLGDLIVHRGRVVSGEARVGAEADAQVDVDRRRSVSRAHTATHLVHKAFRDALGESATQAGSLNAPGRFRFDFASPSAVPASVLADVEQQINEVALADLEVRAFVTTQDEARRIGAMALFGEKYGDAVRVVEVGDYARELCGGTHAQRSGQLGMVKLLSEASIGSGVRRVEGLVGLGRRTPTSRASTSCWRSWRRRSRCRPRRCPTGSPPPSRACARSRRSWPPCAPGGPAAGGGLRGRRSRRRGRGVRPRRGARGHVRRPRAAAGPRRPGPPRSRPAGRGARRRRWSTGDPRAAVNDAGRARGLSANAVLREAAAAVGGKGGGKDDVAQGGGSDASGIPDALARAEALVLRVASGG
jgi:alanyl-tRNA synthetase